jgi:hypothetical protein
MFFPGSRYEKMPAFTITTADGRQVTTVKLPLPNPVPLRGFHQRREGQRLDHLAARYFRDATTFWRFCDSNDAMLPDALAAHDFIGIPGKE